ncbi:DUF3307 domain-containing protein [Soonwooa sp.]|uniref:DUF3307 domain-containing protein n=1 Tax=Soonwooa sp. TaxID=1938592 RepID=UPI0028AE71B3|nr:DUF3307 domain-containing protein [Soonwooa sp.]
MIFLPLILAHLLGDFVFQPNAWVKDKEQKKLASTYLYIHVLLHTILSFVFLWNLHYWWIALLVGITHFVIDAAKLQFQKPKNKRLWFFIDQFLHIAVIIALSLIIQQNIDWSIIFNETTLKLFTAATFLTTPCSIIIKLLISFWTPNPQDKDSVQTDSLANAGKYIGILERLMVFVFIIVNHWEGVGFMIAAKSVFRFSDLAQAKQRKLTEYVLIGTLLSFGIAILTGILVQI